MAEFLRITLTGKVRDTNEVFEKGEKVPAILGESQLIRGLEDALSGMAVGEEKTVEILPEKAFGERDPSLVKLVPLKTFADSGVTPRAGTTVIMDNGLRARIQSVSGGRVRVDFNHVLAGKTLIYSVKVDEKIADKSKQIQAVFEIVFPQKKDAVIVDKAGETEIKLPKDCTTMEDYQARKLMFVDRLKKFLKLEKIKISEEF